MQVTIDNQGRILIPADVRGKLRLDPDTPLEISIQGNEMVIRKRDLDLDLEKKVAEWKQKMLSMTIEGSDGDVRDNGEESGKWMDRDHVEQKLGLR